MTQVTIGLSVHRPEMTPYISDQMRRHEAIFLEEPPDPGFKKMLAGSFDDTIVAIIRFARMDSDYKSAFTE